MTAPDVPAEVAAAIDEAVARIPREQPEDTAAARTAYWNLYAAADEQLQREYDRLWQWAVDSGQPDAVVSAIDSAVRFHRLQAREARQHAQEAGG